MTGRWPRIALALALLMLAGHFVREWRQADVQQAAVQLVPPALPASPVRVNNGAIKEILAHNVLDKNRGRAAGNTGKMQGRKKNADKTWHLLATAVRQFHAPVAVISAGGKMKSVHEGDMLPGGARLLQVMRDGIAVKKNGKEHDVYLFGKKK